MIHIALCDDDKDFMSTLAHLIYKFFKNRNTPVDVSSFFDGNLLITEYTNNSSPYDIVFLDIDLAGLNGKDVAGSLRKLDSYFQLIFVTSYQNEVFNCFEFDVSDFIPKHMIGEKLYKSLERILLSIEARKINYSFHVKDKKNNSIYIKVLLDDILYFECVQKKVYLNLKKESFCIHKCVWKEIIEKYAGSDFIQPHRGYLVRIKHIAAILEDRIELDNGTLLPLGRRNKRFVQQMFLNVID